MKASLFVSAHLAEREDARRDMGGGGLLRIAVIDDAARWSRALMATVGPSSDPSSPITTSRTVPAPATEPGLRSHSSGDEMGGAGFGAAIGLDQTNQPVVIAL